ncbi:MAG: DUF3987 domain-containing protein [Oligoflexia bacterium]|nr:DUF3987 domain-containing protein [Oligoflexia bacterium]
MNNDNNILVPILPTPTYNRSAFRRNIFGEPTGIWEYLDENKNIHCIMVRYDFIGDKKYLPKTYGNLNGKIGWHNKKHPNGNILYNLPTILIDKDFSKLILIVEGEKAAEAAQKLFPNMIVTTSMFGNQTASKTDWSPLAGKPVCIWPDKDKAGDLYAESVIQQCKLVKARKISLVNVPENFPDGWDLADELPVDVSLSDINLLITNAHDRSIDVTSTSSIDISSPLIHEEDSVCDNEIKSDVETNSLEKKTSQLNFNLTKKWPPYPAKDAFNGIAGKIVNIIDPHAESDQVALLIQFLTVFGNIVGRNPYFMVGGTRHGINLFNILVGDTSLGRKGTSLDCILYLFEKLNCDDWNKKCIQTGLSSGEGLMWAIRDPIEKLEKDKSKNGNGKIEMVVADPGISDKRLLILETEFSRVLKVMEREDNTLSNILRDAWDAKTLSNLTKNDSLKASNPHISIIGHVTKSELYRYLNNTEAANGFANRFNWICVRRSKLLPEGGNLNTVDFSYLIKELISIVEFSKQVNEMRRNDSAKEIWKKVYEPLTDGRPGLLGAMIARGAPQVMRFSCIYALLDKSFEIRSEHLMSALALFDYIEESCEYIFGEALGDPLALV